MSVLLNKDTKVLVQGITVLLKTVVKDERVDDLRGVVPGERTN